MSASTPAIVRLLVAKGADVNSVDQYGWSALVHAVDMVYIDVFVALREAGASLNVAVRRGQEMLSLAGFIEEKITHLKELGHPRPNAKLSGMLHDLGRMLEMVQVAR
jgi:ankyrin repeat protein